MTGLPVARAQFKEKETEKTYHALVPVTSRGNQHRRTIGATRAPTTTWRR
jgi:hypothetical protein